MQEHVRGHGQHLVARRVWVTGTENRLPNVVFEDQVVDQVVERLTRGTLEIRHGRLPLPPTPEDHQSPEAEEHRQPHERQLHDLRPEWDRHEGGCQQVHQLPLPTIILRPLSGRSENVSPRGIVVKIPTKILSPLARTRGVMPPLRRHPLSQLAAIQTTPQPTLCRSQQIHPQAISPRWHPRATRSPPSRAPC